MSATPFPLDYNLFRAAIANEVTRVTGVPCILEEQKGQFSQTSPRPPLPYFSFKFTTPGVKLGDDSIENITPTKINVGGNRRATVSFHCYAIDAETAYNFMSLWQIALELPMTQEKLRRAGLAIWNNTTVADLSQLLNTGYEGRSQMDVQFGVSANYAQELGYVETVKTEGDVDLDSEVLVQENTTP